jgi:hypothetical protein
MKDARLMSLGNEAPMDSISRINGNRLFKQTTVSQAFGDIKQQRLCDIAAIIYHTWTNPYFGAKPYIQAMQLLENMDSMFGCDDAKDIVLRFLCNAQSWRGPIAREVKAELKRRLK